MIELFTCDRLSASITRKQCEVNQLSIVSCRGCSGLGKLVEVFDGSESEKVAKSWNKGLKASSQKGASVRPRTTAAKDSAPLDEMGIEEVDTPPRTISFDVFDEDDLSLLRKMDDLIYGTGLTIGDEIMLRLRFLEAHL